MQAESTEYDYCGLMLVTDDPTGKTKAKFNLFHQLDEEKYLAFEEAALRIRRIVDGGLIVYARRALADVEGVAGQIRKVLETVPASRVHGLFGDMRVATSCAVLTFCSALHLYQEQSEGEVARHYGASSAELTQLRRSFSVAYDSSLAYRLIYRLRNVLVHHSLRCVGLNLAGREEYTPAGLILHRHTVRMPLIRGAFLSAKKGVSASIAKELNDMDGDPDLLDLCPAAMAALQEVHKNISHLVYPNLVRDAELMCELDALFGDRPGDRGLAKMLNLTSNSGTSLPHMLLGRDLFDYAKQVVLRQTDVSAAGVGRVD